MVRRRGEQVRSITVEEALTDYLSGKRRRDGKALKERTRADMRQALAETFSDWKEKPISEISRRDIELRYKKAASRSLARAIIAFWYFRAVWNYWAAGDGELNPPLTLFVETG